MKLLLIKYLHFIITGILVLFSLAKFLVLPSPLPVLFFLIEFISYLFILLLVVFLDRVYYANIKKEKNLLEEIENIKRLAEGRESQLLKRIMKLETNEREAILFSTHKKKTLAHIFEDTNKTQTSLRSLDLILRNLSKSFEIVAGVVYLYDAEKDLYVPKCKYALDDTVEIQSFSRGEGFCGQAVKDRVVNVIENVPSDYFVISSGLGDSLPNSIYLLPVVDGEKAVGLFELGTFKKIDIVKIWPDLNDRLVDLLKMKSA